MADLHSNPFGILPDDDDENKPIAKKKEKEVATRKPVQFPGDSGQKKKASPATTGKTPTKPNPATKAAPQISPSATLTTQDAHQLRSSLGSLLLALDDVTGGTTALFKVTVSPKTTDYFTSLLRDKPYKAIDEILRTDKFNDVFMASLRYKHAGTFTGITDLRAKPLSVRVEKKYQKSDFVEKLVSLLTWDGRNKQKTPVEASRLVYDLLEPIFGLKPEENKYITYLEEKMASEIGSQGNSKSGGATLADFIVAPKKQQKKKRAPAKEEAKPAQAPTSEAPRKSEEASPDTDFDPIYNPETITKSIPFGWQFGSLNKSVFRRKAEATGTTRDWYFNGTVEDLDNAFVFWNNSDIVFLFTTGNQ